MWGNPQQSLCCRRSGSKGQRCSRTHCMAPWAPRARWPPRKSRNIPRPCGKSSHHCLSRALISQSHRSLSPARPLANSHHHLSWCPHSDSGPTPPPANWKKRIQGKRVKANQRSQHHWKTQHSSKNSWSHQGLKSAWASRDSRSHPFPPRAGQCWTCRTPRAVTIGTALSCRTPGSTGWRRAQSAGQLHRCVTGGVKWGGSYCGLWCHCNWSRIGLVTKSSLHGSYLSLVLSHKPTGLAEQGVPGNILKQYCCRGWHVVKL